MEDNRTALSVFSYNYVKFVCDDIDRSEEIKPSELKNPV